MADACGDCDASVVARAPFTVVAAGEHAASETVRATATAAARPGAPIGQRQPIPGFPFLQFSLCLLSRPSIVAPPQVNQNDAEPRVFKF